MLSTELSARHRYNLRITGVQFHGFIKGQNGQIPYNVHNVPDRRIFLLLDKMTIFVFSSWERNLEVNLSYNWTI